MVTVFAVALFAVVADRLFGEPPLRWHPLVWLGNLATRVEERLCDGAESATSQRRAGVVAVLAVLLVAICPVLLLDLVLPDLLLGVLVLALALGGRSLVEHATAVSQPLEEGDLNAARGALSHIVSRDTRELDATAVSRATVESVLENGADAVFAALFWAAVFGPIGAVVYRASNTLDAMWGYRNARYAHFGWAAARLDDVLNWVPARLTAMTYTVLGSSRSAWRAWRSHRWYSGNAGAVMASGAGALGLALGGDAEYGGELKSRPRLGDGRDPTARDIGRACDLVTRGVGFWLVCLACAALGSLT
ncbi:MAG: adenosylcobinamide-phosphate synthase CbiB [Pseudomonadota bacterium]